MVVNLVVIINLLKDVCLVLDADLEETLFLKRDTVMRTCKETQ